MKSLRVLTISHMFPSAQSQRHGVFICREAKYLRTHGIECDFLVGRPWAPWPLNRFARWQDYGPGNPLVPPDGLAARRVSYVRPPGFGFRRVEGKSLALSLLKAVGRWHRENPFSLVLAVSMLPDAEAAVVVGQKLGLPVASLAVGSDVMVYPNRMPILWKRLSDTLRLVDLPMGVSQSICRKLAETGECRREPVCAYLSSDTNDFAPACDKGEVRRQLGVRSENIIAIYLGGLVESKGMYDLAEACEPLLRKYKEFSLVCVGDGPDRDVLSRVAERVGREDAIMLPGRVRPSEVAQFLQASDFLVLPSHSEGLPQAVIEAMFCQLAVVATNVGGVSEAVVDGQTGLLLDARNVDQLRDAMERMIVDEGFRLAAGREGRKRAEEVFDPERNARVFADALKSVVSGRDSGDRSQ